MSKSLAIVDPNARPEYFRNVFQECIFVFTVMLATASTTFLQGAILINTAGIGRSLFMSQAQITWISAAIGLASGSFMLLFGKTADLCGRKVQLMVGMGFLAAVSLVTAFAQTPMMMNVLCGFLGLGTAIISPPSIGILFATYPEGRRRNKVTGALGAGNPVGFVLGSISSGVATKYSSWRASFIAIAIFFSVMTIVSTWTVPSSPRPRHFWKTFRRFDYLGTILTIAGMAILIAGLTEGPELGWKDRKVLVMLALGAVLILAFFIWEKVYSHPILDSIVWRNTNFTLCILCVFFGYMSFITNQFWLSLYMQEVERLTPLLIAVRLLPQAIVGILWSYLGQWLVSRISGKVIMTIGAIAYVVGAILCYFVTEGTSYWRFLFPELCITVIGADFQFIVSNLYITQQMPQQSSLAAGVLQTAMRFSIAIGLGITSGVYGSATKTRQGVVDVVVAYKQAYLCSVAFAAAGLLLVPFLKIGRQGKSVSTGSPCGNLIYEQPRRESDLIGQLPMSQASSEEHFLRHQASVSSIWSRATAGSRDSLLPRWSWEPDWPDDRDKYKYADSPVQYEVCIRCSEERKVIVPGVKNFNPYLGPHGWVTNPGPFQRPQSSYNLSTEPSFDDNDHGYPRSSFSREYHHWNDPGHGAQRVWIVDGSEDGGFESAVSNQQTDSFCERSLNLLSGSANRRQDKSSIAHAASSIPHSSRSTNYSSSYYSVDGPREVKSAADLKKLVTQNAKKLSDKAALDLQQKGDSAVHLSYDERDSLPASVNAQIARHKRSRHPFEGHGQDMSGSTLHDQDVEYPSNIDGTADVKPFLNSRNLTQDEGSRTGRGGKVVSFVKGPLLQVLDNSQRSGGGWQGSQYDPAARITRHRATMMPMTRIHPQTGVSLNREYINQASCESLKLGSTRRDGQTTGNTILPSQQSSPRPLVIALKKEPNNVIDLQTSESMRQGIVHIKQGPSVTEPIPPSRSPLRLNTKASDLESQICDFRVSTDTTRSSSDTRLGNEFQRSSETIEMIPPRSPLRNEASGIPSNHSIETVRPSFDSRRGRLYYDGVMEEAMGQDNYA